MILSSEVQDFLKNEIFPKMQIKTINNDNSSIIVDFITNNYEIPLAQAKEAGQIIDEKLLQVSALTVTEITKNW